MISKQDALTGMQFHAENGCTVTVGPRGGVKVTMEIWRANGSSQTWKTRDDVKTPVKYGMGYGRGSYSYVRWPQEAHLWHVGRDCPVYAYYHSRETAKATATSTVPQNEGQS